MVMEMMVATNQVGQWGGWGAGLCELGLGAVCEWEVGGEGLAGLPL